jgi:hypothetical protein
LDENIQALFDREGGIEDNEAETQREDVVAVADFQEIANGTLFDAALVKISMCGSPATSSKVFATPVSPFLPFPIPVRSFTESPTVGDI